jgi:group I intron endonuclease
MYTIYHVWCKTSEKSYVGLTKETLAKRWRRHCLRAAYGEKTHFWNAIRDHGKESFEIKALSEGATREEANALEMLWIALLNTRDPNVGYNLTAGGEGVSNPSPETRLKLRNGRLGKKASSETLKKMSEARKGISPTNKRSDIADNDLIRLYSQGFSLHEIGDKFNCNWSTIRLRLLNRGVTMRPANRRKGI